MQSEWTVHEINTSLTSIVVSAMFPLNLMQSEWTVHEINTSVADPGGLKVSIETPPPLGRYSSSAVCLPSMLRCKQANPILFIVYYLYLLNFSCLSLTVSQQSASNVGVVKWAWPNQNLR